MARAAIWASAFVEQIKNGTYVCHVNSQAQRNAAMHIARPRTAVDHAGADKTVDRLAYP